MESYSPILIIDDEESNVAYLKRYLEKIGRDINEAPTCDDPLHSPHFYVESSADADEALNFMREQMNKGENLGAIISDNHLGRGDIDSYDVNGDDFLRIIRGRPAYCLNRRDEDAGEPINEISSFDELFDLYGGRDSAIGQYLSEKFDDNFEDYKAFCRYWSGERNKSPLLILFCGHPSEAHLDGIEEEVTVVHKSYDLEGVTCERVILGALMQGGALPKEITEKLIALEGRLREGAPARRRTYRP